MTGIQIFLLFVVWVPVVVTLILMCCAIDCIYSVNDRKVSAQITLLFAVQLIAAVVACVFHVLLLPVAIISVIIMVLAIILSNREHPLRLSDVRNYFSSLKEEKREDLEASDKPKKSHKKFWLWFLLLVALLALGYGTAFVAKKSFVLVNQGERGIRLSFGKVVQKSYGPGLVWYLPFSEDWGNKVIKVEVRPQRYGYNVPVRTKELQKVSLDCSVLLQLVPDSIHILYDKYTGYEAYEQNVVRDLVQQTMLTLSSQMSFWSFAEETNSLMADAVTYIVNDQLIAQNLVKVEVFRLKGYQASPEVEALIEKTVQAHKNIELEQLKLEMAKIETEKVKQEAVQTYERLAAVAKANGIDVQIKAEALKNPFVAQYEVAKALQKWNGNLTLPNTLMTMSQAAGGNGGVTPSIFPIMPITTK